MIALPQEVWSLARPHGGGSQRSPTNRQKVLILGRSLASGGVVALHADVPCTHRHAISRRAVSSARLGCVTHATANAIRRAHGGVGVAERLERCGEFDVDESEAPADVDEASVQGELGDDSIPVDPAAIVCPYDRKPKLRPTPAIQEKSHHLHRRRRRTPVPQPTHRRTTWTRREVARSPQDTLPSRATPACLSLVSTEGRMRCSIPRSPSS